MSTEQNTTNTPKGLDKCDVLGCPAKAEVTDAKGNRYCLQHAPEKAPTTPDDDDKGEKWPFDHKRQLDDCYRRAFMLYGCLVGRGSLPMPILQSQDDCNEAQLAIDAIMEGLALLDGIPFKND